MTPSASGLLDNARPPKRPRKEEKIGQSSRRGSEDTVHSFPSPPPAIDHIFINESLSTKKTVKKAPLSCCECRRLKLKCDRTFPCGSCKKRGVSDICPDGVLVSGKGTRFILANTEQLHSKIHEMSERIRKLEEALTSCSEGHPLLETNLLGIKSTMGLYNGQALDSSAAETSKTPEKSPPSMDVDSPTPPPRVSFKPPDSAYDDPDFCESEVMRLSHNFPLPEARMHSYVNIPLRQYIRNRLPSREDADYLWTQTRENALWQYNPHPNETFFPNLLHHCYDLPVEEVTSRRLALMFMILSVGCLVDLRNRPPDHPDSEKYFILARAALSEVNVMEDTTVETITALFYGIWYLLVFSDKKKAAGYAWGLMGLTAKIAQGIGLHRNGSKTKVIPEEVEKRRSLFWELLYLDARLSLSLGRPPSLSLAYMDCKRPSYSPDMGCHVSESLHYYQEWKHSCYVHCLAPVLDAISKPTLDYETMIALDARIRDFSVPAPLRVDASNPAVSRSIIMQRASLATALETVLLQLHRTFFTRALSGPETAFNRNHVYAPSVVAVFLSASRMIATIQDLYEREPQLTARILGYWSNAFSAAVALCLLVSRAPFTCLAPATLQELERARALFRSAKDVCPRAQQVIPVLEAMVAKANDIYTRWSNGHEVPTLILRHTDDYPESPTSSFGSSSPSPQPTSDPFAKCHRSLSQCIKEVHERAARLFPSRKPCQCSKRASAEKDCPPSHSWAPPPNVPLITPVLPDLYLSNLSKGVLACGGGNTPQSLPPLSPNSKFAVVETLNFELGALNPGAEQSWMAWF